MPEVLTNERTTHKAGVLIHRSGGLVSTKSINTNTLIPDADRSKNYGWLEGYLVSWGNDGDSDLQGEYFTPRTQFCLDWFPDRPVLYHHGMDGEAGLRKIGTIKAVESDDLGMWVQAQLDLRDRYANAVYDMIKAKEFGWSSGSVDHLVKISQKGEILVWPLIEGSITPTPAQPSKTTVRAFKALIQGDATPEYLKGLNTYVENGIAKIVPDAEVDSVFTLPVKPAQKYFNISSKKFKGETLDMPNTSSYRIAREVVRSLGLRGVTPDEVEAVASEIEPVVIDEVAQAAADELETEAALAALEDEMAGAMEDEMAPTVASYRRSRRGYRADDEDVESKSYRRSRRGYRADEVVADQIASQMDEIAAEMADEIAAEMEDELAAQMEDELAPTVASYRRSRRGYRADDLEDDAVMAEEVLDQVAAQAYRKGLEDGLEEATMAEDELVPSTASYRRLGRSYRADEEDETEKAFQQGYRTALRRSLRADDEEALMAEDEEALMADDELVPATASYRRLGRGYRGDEEALMTEDEEALMAEEEILTGKTYRSRTGARKSVGYKDNSEYWRTRAIKAELMEAPGQRSFNRYGSVRDVADREGAYTNAFKAYLTVGLGMMTDSEKYVLRAKGQTNWGDVQGVSRFDSATKSVKTYNSGTDSAGGFAVPPDWVNELNKNIMSATVMAGECKTRTTTSDRIIQPNLVTTDGRRAHAARVRWPGELPAATDHRATEDTYSQVDVPIHVMLISMAASNSSLEDITFSLEDEINEAFSEAVAVAYDELIWGGDGQGKMQGIVNNSQVNGSASTGVTSVSGYVATGSTDGIVNADCLKQMLFHLPRGYRAKAKWFMNSDTGLQISTLKDGEGNYLIDQRDEALQNVGVPERLLGLPIVYNEYASDVSSGNYPIVLADLSRGYIIGKRVDFSIRRFDDSNYAELDQVLFLGRARIGGQVLQPAAIKLLKVATS